MHTFILFSLITLGGFCLASSSAIHELETKIFDSGESAVIDIPIRVDMEYMMAVRSPSASLDRCRQVDHPLLTIDIISSISTLIVGLTTFIASNSTSPILTMIILNDIAGMLMSGTRLWTRLRNPTFPVSSAFAIARMAFSILSLSWIILITVFLGVFHDSDIKGLLIGTVGGCRFFDADHLMYFRLEILCFPPLDFMLVFKKRNIILVKIIDKTICVQVYIHHWVYSCLYSVASDIEWYSFSKNFRSRPDNLELS